MAVSLGQFYAAGAASRWGGVTVDGDSLRHRTQLGAFIHRGNVVAQFKNALRAEYSQAVGALCNDYLDSCMGNGRILKNSIIRQVKSFAESLQLKIDNSNTVLPMNAHRNLAMLHLFCGMEYHGAPKDLPIFDNNFEEKIENRDKNSEFDKILDKICEEDAELASRDSSKAWRTCLIYELQSFARLAKVSLSYNDIVAVIKERKAKLLYNEDELYKFCSKVGTENAIRKMLDEYDGSEGLYAVIPEIKEVLARYLSKNVNEFFEFYRGDRGNIGIGMRNFMELKVVKMNEANREFKFDEKTLKSFFKTGSIRLVGQECNVDIDSYMLNDIDKAKYQLGLDWHRQTMQIVMRGDTSTDIIDRPRNNEGKDIFIDRITKMCNEKQLPKAISMVTQVGVGENVFSGLMGMSFSPDMNVVFSKTDNGDIHVDLLSPENQNIKIHYHVRIDTGGVAHQEVFDAKITKKQRGHALVDTKLPDVHQVEEMGVL